MNFQPSERGQHWRERVRRFMDEQILPREAEYRAQVHADPKTQPAVMEELKRKLPDCRQFISTDVSPALSVHTGPGLIGISVQALQK